MSMRELFERNSYVTASICAVAVVASIWMVFGSFGDNRVADRKWMLDLNTRQIIVAPRTTVAPADIGSGANFDYPGMKNTGAVVDAALYSCGDVESVKDGATLAELEEVGIYVGYVSRYTDAAYEFLLSGEEIREELPVVVSDATGQKWYPRSSDASSAVLDSISRLCGGSVPKALRP